MTDEGRDFAEALREAQAAGYAEADPTLDIEGIDSAHKLQILASLAFRTRVDLKDIHTAGIARLEAAEITYARELGYRVKLLAIAKATDGALEARVHPTLIPAGTPLAAVSGAFNAILVTGDAAGDQMFYGRGAGQMPTASAVWSDAIEIARRAAHQHVALTEDYPLGGERRLRMRPMSEVRSAYYLRAMVQDRPGVLSQVAGILGRHEISIATVIQKGRAGAVPIVMMTHEALDRNMGVALEEIDRLGVVAVPTVMLRVEAEDLRAERLEKLRTSPSSYPSAILLRPPTPSPGGPPGAGARIAASARLEADVASPRAALEPRCRWGSMAGA